MEVDEGGTSKIIKHGNVESVDDEEFFEFEDVLSHFKEYTEEELAEGSEKGTIPHCKFCWMPATEKENPLISACKCSGSVGYIHYNCLKQWLDAKKQVKEGDNF
jgi:hypothetical protein